MLFYNKKSLLNRQFATNLDTVRQCRNFIIKMKYNFSLTSLLIPMESNANINFECYSATRKQDYFEKIFQHYELKWSLLCFCFLSVCATTPLLYGIIWYEKYGIVQQKRTLISGLVSSTSRLAIAWNALVQVCSGALYY